MKKIILIIIDGLSDKPIDRLEGKTPLEAAITPNLDWLAKNGICGLIQPFQFPWQKFPKSDVTHLALFGYNPKVYYLDRGPYEAAGIGMKMRKGDIALRVNFATLSKNLKVIDRRAGRISETKSLIKSLNGIKIDGIKFLLKKSVGHRAVLVLREKNLSEKISDGDPEKEGEKAKKITPLDNSKEAKFTAKVLNEFLEKAHQILKNHPLNKKRERKGLLPANYLLFRGAGKLRKTPSFYQKYQLRSCCIAGGGLYKGIGKILGMDEILVKGANTLPTTNLKGKIQAVKKALKKYDFIFCHIKAADNLSEDGNFLAKKDFIEKIDKNLKPIFSLKNTLIVITADHSTSSLLKRHCSEPVPILIYGLQPTRHPPVHRDSVKEFSEKACKKGKLGQFNQLNLMEKILKIRASTK